MSQDAAGDHVPSEPAMPSGQQSQISHGEHHAGRLIDLRDELRIGSHVVSGLEHPGAGRDVVPHDSGPGNGVPLDVRTSSYALTEFGSPFGEQHEPTHIQVV